MGVTASSPALVFGLAAMSGVALAQAGFDTSTRILSVPTIDVDGTVYQNLQASLDADGRLTIRSLANPAIPQGACIERQMLQTFANSPPPGYLAVLAWAQAMTVSPTHPASASASVEIDYLRVLEQDLVTGQLSAVTGAGEEYSLLRAPLGPGEGALRARSPRCAPGSGSTTISGSRVAGGILSVDVAATPNDYAHWWTPRGDVAPGKRHLVEARFRVNGAAALQFGLDYWRNKSIGYNGYDVTCAASNNCEAWVSAWIGDTQGAFIVRQFPVGLGPAFQLSGDPESSSGATWTYRATTDGIAYDLRGILKKPPGPGPFPAVVLSHGGEQNALTMAAPAAEMATWGLVGIATNYTHATDTGAPIGSPGTAGERGATESNILRARKVLEILSSLGYVDMNRVAAFGISNGGFVTTATVATHPSAFRVAAHAAAGVQDPATGAPSSAPTASLAAGVRIPYSMHHGDPDPTNPLSSDQRFASILAANSVPHELWVYPGAGHVGFIQTPAFYARIRAWYARFGLF